MQTLQNLERSLDVLFYCFLGTQFVPKQILQYRLLIMTTTTGRIIHTQIEISKIYSILCTRYLTCLGKKYLNRVRHRQPETETQITYLPTRLEKVVVVSRSERLREKHKCIRVLLAIIGELDRCHCLVIDHILASVLCTCCYN